MSDLDELTEELLQDPSFAEEYKKLKVERDLAISLFNARKNAGLTQMELSKKQESAKKQQIL